MQFRHELKYEINAIDAVAVRARLKAVCKPDANSKDGKYFIRSLYFDSPSDKALREKLDGVRDREKFRIRYYNGDTSFIRLEKKIKRGSFGYKLSAVLSADEAAALARGDFEWAKNAGRPLLNDLYTAMRNGGFRAKTVVDYTREAFVFEAGNTRVTLDYNIRTGLSSTDFLNPRCPTVPIKDNTVIMEVKWDNYLPSIIKDLVRIDNRRQGAFSKYAACRAYD
ncbi:MAG: polyphosphate polymerase domain-containing protein [Clostridia bacterium]|nr:polyphosphate polymerase domain-containing protein [Clostridia bacterium]